MARGNIFKLYGKLYKDIQQNQKSGENYHTGLMGEALIIASYKTMEIGDLEKIRFIINKIIEKKKIIERIKENARNIADLHNNSDSNSQNSPLK